MIFVGSSCNFCHLPSCKFTQISLLVVKINVSLSIRLTILYEECYLMLYEYVLNVCISWLFIINV